jgi:alcohol dehydrogenase class IV
MQDKYFEFLVPTRVVFQPGGGAQAGAVAARANLSKPFLVADRVLAQVGLVDRVASTLQPAGMFLDVPADGDLATCERIAAEMKAAGADGIVAVGGGSVIDSAKGANIVFTHGGTLADHQGVGVLQGRLAPLVVIPTTAGTGSEVSRIAALKDPAQHVKLFFESEYLAADLALLDPEMTASMPPKLTAATGMDAMTHAVESLFASNASPLTDALAVYAMQAIFRWLPSAVMDGKNFEARGQMLFAATAAGAAFSNAGVGIVHACAHAMGALKSVHHGVANSIMLPHGVRFNANGHHAHLPKDAADRLAALARECGLPMRLRDVGIAENDLVALADYAAGDGALITNPKEATRDDILGLFRNAF